jgi:HK97 gp10 family phage protein
VAGPIVVTGIKEIDRKLKTLEVKVQRKVLRQSMRKGMKLVLQDAVSRVPVLSGLLKRNIKLRAMKRKKNRVGLLVQIKPDPGFYKHYGQGQIAWYPASVEWGHGRVPPHPFMRPAYDLKGNQAKLVTMQELLEGTLREAKA